MDLRSLTIVFFTIGCGASVLSGVDDSIDVGRVGLKDRCRVETANCEFARISLNDAIGAYDKALEHQNDPDAERYETAAVDALGVFKRALERLRDEP